MPLARLTSGSLDPPSTPPQPAQAHHAAMPARGTRVSLEVTAIAESRRPEPARDSPVPPPVLLNGPYDWRGWAWICMCTSHTTHTDGAIH